MVKSKADASSFGIDPDQERIISKIDMSQDEIIQKLVENISEPPKLPQANTIVYTPPIIGDDNEVDETIETHTVEEVIDSRATISTIDFNEGVDDLTAPTADIENRITETENTTFVYVEKMPEYPGGEQKIYQDISKVLQYPTVAQESGKQGRVVIRFIVRKDGSIDMVEVVRGFHPSCNKEAIRVVSNMQNGYLVCKMGNL